MIAISYLQMVIVISILWLIVRAVFWFRSGQIDWGREALLLPVYICLVVVVRFTFCPFSRVNGEIQPLLFDGGKVFPFWLNVIPFVYLFDYPSMKDALLNLIGNIALFIPLGVVWPAVFQKLDNHWKVIGAGFGTSLCIEILQLPFYGRASDIDDLILNTAGYLLGYGIWLLVKKIKGRRKGNP